MKALLLQVACLTTFVFGAISAAEPATISAKELADKMSASRQDGHSYIRVKLSMKGVPDSTLQLAIKSRRTPEATDVLYQVLWPKERKEETVLLHQTSSGVISGSTFNVKGGTRPLDATAGKLPLYGSDLSYEDVVDNFYTWENQSIAGNEQIDGANCVILESKPGKIRSSYSSVKSWIDLRRMVPLRVEKYQSGSLVRRMDTTRVVTEDGRSVPATLEIRRAGQGSITEFEGSKIRRDVNYTAADFVIDSAKP